MKSSFNLSVTCLKTLKGSQRAASLIGVISNGLLIIITMHLTQQDPGKIRRQQSWCKRLTLLMLTTPETVCIKHVEICLASFCRCFGSELNDDLAICRRLLGFLTHPRTIQFSLKSLTLLVTYLAVSFHKRKNRWCFRRLTPTTMVNLTMTILSKVMVTKNALKWNTNTNRCLTVEVLHQNQV